jgi:hypothetical protein
VDDREVGVRVDRFDEPRVGVDGAGVLDREFT